VTVRSNSWPSVLSLALLTLWSVTVAADDDGPMLHEYLPPDERESADLARTDASGTFPEAVETKSGLIQPPDIRTSPLPSRVYHQQSADASGFRPDRDTRRPNIEQYDDPFTPSMTPFKRMNAYDAVREDYSLYVQDGELRAVNIGGTPTDDDDRFFGDMMIQLHAGEAVRIPNVGPGARLIKLATSPETKVTVLQDSGENWFIKSEGSDRVRLVTELSIAREVFASEYPDISWAELPQVPQQPAAHRQAYLEVAKAIGISRDQSPREVVTKMVTYYRSFAASDEPPQGSTDIYLDLALSKKGVCRHRAFAFLVTALNIGIPARLVHNEAHAWVEVRDHRLWHRIDLGGAALDLEEDQHLDRPPHVPPPDAFSWPTGRDSGADLARRERAEAAEAEEATDPNSPGPFDPMLPGEPDPNAPNPAKDMPPTTLTIEEVDRDIFRGLPVKIRGKAALEAQPCPHLRVDVFLLLEGGSEKRRLGSLSTDEGGDYAGEIVMPGAIPIGDHELVVATPGAGKCGPGQAR
jgi:hypothetical protein